MVKNIRHGHSSSLYSSSPDSLAKQVDKAVSAENPDAVVLTFTEVGSDKRKTVLKEADPDEWASWVPGKSDVGLMWNKQIFDPLWKEPHKLTDKIWTDGQGRKHETWAATALLKDKGSGHTLFLSVCHLPSHVQNGKKFYDNAQAKAWKSAVNGWSKYWNNCRKRDHPTLAMLVADWNIDFHMSTWRDYVKDVFPSMYLCWAGDNMPPSNKGTHGDRLIDATWSTKKATVCKLLKDDDSSDHRPFGEKVPW